MFELRLALKYLMPKKGALSSSIISLVSIFVIALVVWLILLFLSITGGIEKNWLQKLTSINAPIRIAPTRAYFESYYYQIDSISASSNYSYKTLGEKIPAPRSDPYQPLQDMEIPAHWPVKELVDGKFFDPAKSLFQILGKLEKTGQLVFQDYEIASSLLKLKLKTDENKTAFLSQMSYLLSYNDKNPHLRSLIYAEHLLDNTQHKPVYLPKSFQTSQIKLGDAGYLIYNDFSSLSQQEMHIPVYVAGFYDSGVLPIGNKCILAQYEVIRDISRNYTSFSFDNTPLNGIFVWTQDLKKVDAYKILLQKELENCRLSKYFTVSTYKEFEFSKDLLEQFQSDKTLFTLIAIIILVVAFSNIISMLLLLVNDKKKEIALLRSLGATYKNIAAIFGICGMAAGSIGSLIGIICAFFTLKNLKSLVSVLNSINGHNMFNAQFFGDNIPNDFSFDALLFIAIATPIISLLAGIVPAIKAARVCPSSTLRSQ